MMANILVNAPVLMVNKINLLMTFSLCLKPVRERLSRYMRVNAMATSPAAARMLMARERLTIEVSFAKVPSGRLRDYEGYIIIMIKKWRRTPERCIRWRWWTRKGRVTSKIRRWIHFCGSLERSRWGELLWAEGEIRTLPYTQDKEALD